MWLWWLIVPGIYFLWLSWTRRVWNKLTVRPNDAQNTHPLPPVTILVPARNEAATIGYLLKDLIDQDYPESLAEILVINDHSEDATEEVVRRMGCQRVACLSLEHASGKKAALALGLARAKGDWIVTVDADVRMGRQWLSQLLAPTHERQVHAVAGPVAYCLSDEASTLEELVALDNAGMQGLTAVGIHSGHWIMGNGANLAFRKTTVEFLGGYAATSGISSGDDVLLLQKLHKTLPGSIQYLRSPGAMVWTEAPPGWSAFWHQRLRWAGKSEAYTHSGLKYIQALAWLTSAQAIIALFFMPWCGPVPVVVSWGLKGLADFLWLQSTAPHYGASMALRNFALVAPMQWCYIFVVGAAALLKIPVQWKGRPVQHSERK